MTSATEFMRNHAGADQARPCRGHMPFDDHRTVAEIWEKERIREERHRHGQQMHRAKEYGFGG